MALDYWFTMDQFGGKWRHLTQRCFTIKTLIELQVEICGPFRSSQADSLSYTTICYTSTSVSPKYMLILNFVLLYLPYEVSAQRNDTRLR